MNNRIRHDHNGYSLDYLDTLPFGWWAFYQFTGLLPFDWRWYIRHPIRAGGIIATSIKWRWKSRAWRREQRRIERMGR